MPGQALPLSRILPAADWWMRNLGPRVGPLLDPGWGRGLAWQKGGGSGGPSGLVPCHWLMGESSGKIFNWGSCKRITLVVQLLRQEVQQLRLCVMDVYGAYTSTSSIHYLVGIRNLHDPIRSYPLGRELGGSLQRRSSGPDKVAHLVGIRTSGCCCRCHSLMDFPELFLDLLMYTDGSSLIPTWLAPVTRSGDRMVSRPVATMAAAYLCGW